MDQLITNNENNFLVNAGFNEALIDRWMYYLDITNPESRKSYTMAIRRFFQYLADYNIVHPTREDIINYREYLLNATYEKNDTTKTYSPVTVKFYMSTVKIFFGWLEHEKAYENIAIHIKSPKTENIHRKNALTVDQANLVLSAIDVDTLKGARDYAIILTMITTGLRTVSMSLALIGDIYPAGDGNYILYYQGKGHLEKDVSVYLTKEVYDAIIHYLDMRRDKNGRINKTSPLFASTSNENREDALSTRSYREIVKDRMRDIGIDGDKYSAHSLRHTAATINIRNGGTLEETQQLLNHKFVATTMVYIDELKKEENKSEFRITNALFQKKEE